MEMSMQDQAKPVEHIVAAIEALDLDPIKFKLMDRDEGQGWTREYADRMEIEYKRFLTLLVKHPEAAIAPSKEVDKFWHGHILDTLKYAQDCQQVFGYFLHHFPYFGMRGADDAANLAAAGETMRQLYQQEFGDVKTTGESYCGAARQASSYCGAANDESSYCGAAKEASGYCGAAKDETSYCGAAKEASGYCGAAKEASSYCGAAKEASGYCGAAKDETSYCGAAKEASSYCGAAKEASSYCGAAKDETSYCGAAKEVSSYCGAAAGQKFSSLDPREKVLNTGLRPTL
jgi:hypothetical protein